MKHIPVVHDYTTGMCLHDCADLDNLIIVKADLHDSSQNANSILAISQSICHCVEYMHMYHLACMHRCTSSIEQLRWLWGAIAQQSECL